MRRTKINNRRQKMNILLEMNSSSFSRHQSPYKLINKLIRSLSMLQTEYENQNEIYLSKFACRKLKIALAFTFTKSSNENATRVREFISFLDENNDFIATNKIIPIINELINLIKKGKENYDIEEIKYLIGCIAPLLAK